jgi:hypothetical protein
MRMGEEMKLNIFVVTLAFASLASFSTGCASVEFVYVEKSELPRRFETFPWPVMNMTRADFVAMGTFVEKIGPLAVVWLPWFAVDVPISFCADVITTPYQLRRCMKRMPEQEVNSAEPVRRDSIIKSEELGAKDEAKVDK